MRTCYREPGFHAITRAPPTTTIIIVPLPKMNFRARGRNNTSADPKRQPSKFTNAVMLFHDDPLDFHVGVDVRRDRDDFSFISIPTRGMFPIKNNQTTVSSFYAFQRVSNPRKRLDRPSDNASFVLLAQAETITIVHMRC
mmetsp:Transcript_27155/g.56897  ORF Transcript_27155/g.56897 Transcript_27155/m.56897 type:complete len:140 (-) Transcript_27155:564-983(-)